MVYAIKVEDYSDTGEALVSKIHWSLIILKPEFKQNCKGIRPKPYGFTESDNLDAGLAGNFGELDART